MAEFLSKEYWENRYLSGQTGWDMGAVSPPLKAYIDHIVNKSLRILIPGCGNAHEAEYLAAAGFTNITVIDIAEEPTNNLRKLLSKHGPTNVQVVLGDFFDHSGTYDLIIEQTFFCAIDVAKRENYARKMTELLAPGGMVAGVLFNKNFNLAGPPFGGTVAEYQTLFQKYFKEVRIDECYNSHVKRAGNEVFIQLMM